ncbi:MAG: hypothetical protein J7J86_06825 [Bacteroidales bacterium]|nr:hypothetical protein [Bacteroidales bacterium]
MLKRFFLIILLSFLCFSNKGISQNNNKEIRLDTLSTKIHSPKKATIYSAILPGLGQAYNKKYWKIPIIYAGFGTLIYFINTNSKEYHKFLDAYVYKLNKDTFPTNNEYVTRYELADLKTGKDYYRRNMELSYLLTGFWYVINIIDANVDANLFDYDISDDLSLKIEPWFNKPKRFVKSVPGVKLTFNF